MYYNKKVWKLINLVYRRKLIKRSSFVYLYKNTLTNIPRIFWFNKKKLRKFFIHSGKKIVEKNIFFRNINLSKLVKTRSEVIIKKKKKK